MAAWLILATVLPGMFMNVFDFFAVNVATPVLHENLGSGPPTRERRIALGLYGMTIAVGQVSGQALGGILLSANIAGLSWRLIFLVNVPVAAATFAFGFRRVPESRSPARPSLDLAGVGLLTLAAGLLIIPIVEGGSLGWPPWCWLFLAAVPLAGPRSRGGNSGSWRRSRPGSPSSTLASSCPGTSAAASS